MKKLLRRLTLLAVGFVLGVVCAVVALKALRSGRVTPASSPAAVINGEAVSAEEFLFDLKLLFGDQALERIVQQRLVLQECKRLNLSVDEKKLAAALAQLDPRLDPRIKAAFDREVRYRELLGKLLLRNVSEEEKRLLYELFYKELTLYELQGILALTTRDAQDLVDTFPVGADFGQAAASNSLDPASKDNKGRLGTLTLPEIRRTFGPDAAAALRKMKPGQISSPIHCRQGPMIFKLNRVYSSYAELKPAVEGMIARSKRLGLGHELSAKAQVDSLYLRVPGPQLPPEDKAGAGALATPRR
jgi:parvulin-like peptidyl-prolyl isomerase